jgi:microcystin-dependent protein
VSGDGSTTFNLPDKTGRVSAMKEASATRLTNAGSGITGSTMGSAGGAESSTIINANLPAYTPAGTVTRAQVSGNNAISAFNGSTTSIVASGANFNVYQSTQQGSVDAQTFTGTAQGGTSTPFSNAQPTIVCNYIIRII